MLVTACSRQRVHVSSTMLHSHVGELRARGKATIDTEPSGTIELSPHDTVTVGGREVTVASLIDNCPDARPFAGDKISRAKYDTCGLLHVTDIDVDRRWVARPGWIATGVGFVLVLAVVGVVFGYLGSCSEPDDGC